MSLRSIYFTILSLRLLPRPVRRRRRRLHCLLSLCLCHWRRRRNYAAGGSGGSHEPRQVLKTVPLNDLKSLFKVYLVSALEPNNFFNLLSLEKFGNKFLNCMCERVGKHQFELWCNDPGL